MLEKIGLPAKPAMRGGNWVLDASHCQGCSSQFTFINRKHHCRRCGGLFCNNCTLQRMVLRGQGDSSVRICDPCKRIEEAARFELRYGHKSRAAKGGTKHSLNQEDEVMGEILGIDGEKLFLSGQESEFDAISFKSFASTSSSNIKEESVGSDRKEDITRSMSAEITNSAFSDSESTSPEELRQRAVDEKKIYKILKAEGKPAEALQAFKRGKELERQAGALEIALRKNRRMASKAPNSISATVTQKIDGNEDSKIKQKMPSRRSNEAKSDLESDLKELGWSDADLRDSDVNPTKLSLEGELTNILGEVAQNSSTGRKRRGVDKSEVTAIKKSALLLKREGKLVEAKEELKRAKILERKLEEEELLGEYEESDDELSALMHSMDEDKEDDLMMNHAPGAAIKFDQFNGLMDDHLVDGNFDVTDADLNDPELAAALKSFGWSEEDDVQIARQEEDQEQVASQLQHSVPPDREALREKVLNLKREALSKKRAGNVSEAMELLKKAKLLEKDLENLQSDSGTSAAEVKQKSSYPVDLGVSPALESASKEHLTETNMPYLKPPTKSKLLIQKELLALKKRALALRREGRINEAEDELEKGKVLEQQLEEMENATKKTASRVVEKNMVAAYAHEGGLPKLDLVEEGIEADVTEQDMHDPALLSALKNLGWSNDDVESVKTSNKSSKLVTNQPVHDNMPSRIPGKAAKNKAEIHKELLAIKRRALALRRRGNTEEAEEELEKAKALENQMAEMENTMSVHVPKVGKRNQDSAYVDDDDHGTMDLGEEGFETEVLEQDMHDPALLSALKNLGWSNDDVESVGFTNESSTQMNNQSRQGSEPSLSSGKVVRSKAEIQKELLAMKRKALALRRQGNIKDAEEELEKAKALEEQLSEMENATEVLVTKVGKKNVKSTHLHDNDPFTMDLGEAGFEAAVTKQHMPVPSFLPVSKNMGLSDEDGKIIHLESSASDTGKLQFESQMMTETRLSVKETSAEGSSISDQSGQSRNLIDFDNEDNTLLSTIEDSARRVNIDASIFSLVSAFTQPNEKNDLESDKPSKEAIYQKKESDVAATSISVAGEQKFSQETNSLRNEILARKRKAVALKREGKLVEAREELRKAKLLEKSLEDEGQADMVGESVSASTSNDTSVVQDRTSQTQKPFSSQDRFRIQQDIVSESVSASTSSNTPVVRDITSQTKKPLSSRDRFRIQQESLTHKRNALKLRREGKIDEAESELELAKSLEKQLEESDQNSSTNIHAGKLEAKDDVIVDDLLDPQLMSALKAIGLVDAPILAEPSKKIDSQPNIKKDDEKTNLEEQIKAEKLRALNLKKAGKQADALEALRSAKRLEKKLASLG